jgi:cathepsin F
MDHRTFILSFFFFFIFSVSASISSTPNGEEDPLIRQVVDEGGVRLGAEHHFNEFKHRFGKVYSSKDEHDYRFNIFKSNLHRAKRHQIMDPSAVHGVTRFSDLTPREFRNSVLGLRGVRLPSDANAAPILPTDNLPADFDWREHGAVTGVKNQVFYFFYFLFLLNIYMIIIVIIIFLVLFCLDVIWF